MDNANCLGINYIPIYDSSKQEKAKKQKEMLDSLKEGTNIVTIGGIKGTIVAVREEEVDVKVDKGIKVTFVKSAISRVL